MELWWRKREREREWGGRGKWVHYSYELSPSKYSCFTSYKETWRNIMSNLRSYTVKSTWIDKTDIWPQLFNTWITLSTALISIQRKVLVSLILIYWIVIYLVDNTIFCSGDVNTLYPLHFCSSYFCLCYLWERAFSKQALLATVNQPLLISTYQEWRR